MINEYCQDKIWQDNGCPESRYSNDNIPWYLNNTTLKEMKDVAKNYTINPDEYHRKGCYGNDKSKWPVVPNNPVETSHCYNFPNLDSQGLNDCVSELWEENKCTQDVMKLFDYIADSSAMPQRFSNPGIYWNSVYENLGKMSLDELKQLISLWVLAGECY